ncbi:MAG: helix-turn-helix domain-containing protein [Actinomycetota bacterium]|nr:helix-turn-helix domain-containing protein [Actinomycetota bacterium]
MKSVAAELAWVRAMCLSGEARELRQANHVSLSEVGTDVGGERPLSATTVQRWETGKRLPRGDQALAYAAVLRRLRRAARRVPA